MQLEAIKNLKIHDNRMRNFYSSDRRYFNYGITLKSVITRENTPDKLTVNVLFYNENVCNTGIISRIKGGNIDKEVYIVSLTSTQVLIERLTKNRGDSVKLNSLDLLMDYIKNEIPGVAVFYKGEVS